MDTETAGSVPRLLSSRYLSIPVFGINLSPWLFPILTPTRLSYQFDPKQTFLPDILSSCGFQTALFTDVSMLRLSQALSKRFETVNAPTDWNEDFSPWMDRAAAWLRDQGSRQPVFLYLHLGLPHIPYRGGRQEAAFVAGIDPAKISGLPRRLRQIDRVQSFYGWSREDLRILTAIHDGNLHAADRFVGRLLDALARDGSENDTLIAITADHGESLGEHGCITHPCAPWQGLTHVPLIIIRPGLIKPGTIVPGLTEAVDVVPTILDLAGIGVPEDKMLAGISLRGLLGGRQGGKEIALNEHGMRTERYSYIDEPESVYDLESDPKELRNISRDRPDLRDRLRARHVSGLEPHRRLLASAYREKPFAGPVLLPFGRVMRGHIQAEDILIGPWANPRVTASSTAVAWVWNQDSMPPGIGRNPTSRSSATFTVTLELPDGAYEVGLLVQARGGGSLPAAHEMGLRSRFGRRGDFLGVRGEEVAVRHDGSKSRDQASFLLLGTMTVTNHAFTLEVEDAGLHPGEFFLSHMKLEPVVAGSVEASSDLKQMRQTEEALRMLGYNE